MTIYRCLVSLGGETGYHDLTGDQLVETFGMAKAFEINLTSMPLAQTPRGNLLLLVKMQTDNDREAWVRLSLTREQSKTLLDQLMESLCERT